MAMKAKTTTDPASHSHKVSGSGNAPSVTSEGARSSDSRPAEEKPASFLTMTDEEFRKAMGFPDPAEEKRKGRSKRRRRAKAKKSKAVSGTKTKTTAAKEPEAKVEKKQSTAKRKKRTRSANAQLPETVVAALVVTLLAMLAGAAWLIVPRYTDVTQNETAKMTYTGDAWEISWTQFDSGERYRVSLKNSEKSSIFSDIVRGETFVFKQELPEGVYTLRIAGTSGKLGSKKPLFEQRIAISESKPSDARFVVNHEAKMLNLSWSTASQPLAFDLCDITDGNTRLSRSAAPTLVLSYQDGGSVVVPQKGEKLVLGVSAVERYGSCEINGKPVELFTFDRNDFYGTDFDITCEVREDNSVALNWQETLGDRVKLTVNTESGEKVLCEEEIGVTSFETPRLAPSRNYEFHIEAFEDNGASVCTDTVTAQTGISPIYATIWLNKRLDVYADTDKAHTLGTAEPTTMFCVLDEDKELQLFKVRYGDAEGWIDSRYCMINLPDYLGELCAYDITNSYESLYTFHEYEIVGLTGRTVQGYETVRLADNSFLVPLLYPTAQKLTIAAQAALEQGYRLRIYDSYRPLMATNSIYDIATSMLYQPIPYRTYTGNLVALPTIGDESRGQLLMIDFVENNGWELGSFLARGGSYHNKGTALDLTLENATTGVQLPAQTMMHDLGIYSTTYSNNDNAQLLFNIMEGAGLKTIISEWWHFQDNDAQNTLNPDWCNGGVSVKGWHYDGLGWRYRDASGNYIKDNLTETGKVYFFGNDGYVEEEVSAS